MKQLATIFALALVLLFSSVRPSAASAGPPLLPFQGYLTDADGVPKHGFVQIVFSIYSQASGGSVLFSEMQTVTVQDGYFSVYIGVDTPLDPAIFDTSGALYLGVKVDSDSEMIPRTRLASVPYALHAKICAEATTASTLQGFQASAFASSSHSHAWSAITGRPSGLDDGDNDTTYGAAVNGGLTLSGTNFSVDFSLAQRRVTGTCPAGSSIRTINAEGAVSCETDDDTTYGAAVNGGLALSGTNFSVDFSLAQKRVTGTCDAGSAIRTINAEGAAVCETDDDTTYGAAIGGGLALSGTNFSVDFSLAQKRVSGTCDAGSSIRTIDAEGVVTCETNADTTYTAGTGLSLGSGAFSIAPSGVGSAELAAGAVGPRELGSFPSGSASVSGSLGNGPTDLLNPSSFTPAEDLSCLVTVSFAATTGVADTGRATVAVLRLSEPSTFTASSATSVAMPIPGQTLSSTASISQVFTATKDVQTRFGCRVTLEDGSDLSGNDADCHVSWLCF